TARAASTPCARRAAVRRRGTSPVSGGRPRRSLTSALRTPMRAEPLRVELELRLARARLLRVCAPLRATWAPRSHTMSGSLSAIPFEPRAGGRIVERAPGGEHEWGEVLAWEPPERLRCLWHPFFDRSEATEVGITFRAVAAGTAVRIEQRGFERLG